LSPRVGPGWREWGSSETATSVPLQADANVRSRLFPKTRSWFALEAPLALLSPLSVLRVIYAFASLTWILSGLIWPLSDSNRATVLLIGASALVAWLALFRVRRVSVDSSWLLSCLWLVQVSVLVWAGHGGGLSVAATTYFVPIGIFAALYFDTRTVTACQAAIALGMWIALASAVGVLRSASSSEPRSLRRRTWSSS
jgi:hypothetical protein